MKITFLPGLLLIMAGLPVQSMTLPPVPTEPLYYEPPVVKPTENQQRFDCYQLDSAINELHPYRYTYKPNFYSDGSNKLATSLIVVDKLPCYNG